MPETILTVGQVAKRCGVKVSTIHFYEQKGLITSTRNSGNQRQFTRDVLRRISVIKAAQQAGIHLENIKTAFSVLPNNRTPNKQDWQRLARQWRNELNTKINSLLNIRDSLTDCIGCGCLSLKKCPLFNKDDILGEKGTGPVLLNDLVSE